MKRRILTVIAMLISTFCSFGLFACGGDVDNITVPPGTDIPPDTGHTHSYAATVVGPTCVEQGYTLHKCSCGDGYRDNYTDATGEHQYESYTCKFCGRTLTQGLEYSEITENGEIVAYSVSGIGDVTDTKIRIPSTFDGKPVTGIAEQAFYNCYYIDSIEIPDSVTTIGEQAFYSCYRLKSIEIPNSVTSIGDYAFHSAGLTSITIPGSVASIGERVFYYCHRLAEVKISDGVTSIGKYAFSFCSVLESIEIPKSVSSIERHAYERCSSILSITVDSGNSVYHSSGNCLIETSSKTLVVGCKNSVIPTDGSVTSIGGNAFFECGDLTSVTLPDGLTSIGNYAFYKCGSLSDLEIPSGVESIGEAAFSGCGSLTSITLPDSVTSVGEAAFLSCKSLANIIIPDGVTSIGRNAFEDTGYYKDESNWENEVLYIGKHLIEANRLTLSDAYEIKQGTLIIADYAFEGCGNLTSVTIPNSVTRIGYRAFHHCFRLTDVTIGNSVTDIGDKAFAFCTGLTSVTIPSSVKSIGEQAFDYCKDLSVIIFDGTTEQWNAVSKGNDWNNKTGDYTVTCTDGTLSKSEG